MVTTTRSLVEEEGRLHVVVDVPSEDHGEQRPDARTGPDSGGPTTMAEDQRGNLWPPTNNQHLLGARDRFLLPPPARSNPKETNMCRKRWA